MKIIIAVIGLAFFIQTICVFETLGEADPQPGNCSEYNSTSCCSIAGCKLYNCSGPAGCENGTDFCSNETISKEQDWCAGTSDAQNTTISPPANTSTTSTQATTTTTVKETTGTTTNGSITTEPETTTNLTVSTEGTLTTTAGALTTTTTKLTPTTGTMATATPTTGSTSGVPSNPSAGDESGRHFDAASFIGGIVLCLGLGVIAFIGLKYYRSRSQQNYRTL